MNSIEQIIQSVIGGFKTNVQSVHVLMDFDNTVLNYAISTMETLCGRLKEEHGIRNPRLTADNALKHLKNIRKNESMRPQYEEIFNQGVVLLVSYFGSCLQDLFEACVDLSLSKGGQADLLKEELKMTIADIKDRNFDLSSHIGNFLIATKGISFQDMQSIRQAFSKYLCADPGKDEITNNIILAQACRHVIVHNGAIADRKLMGQIRNASPRSLKLDLGEKRKVQFSASEVKTVGENMLEFVDRIAIKLRIEIPE